MSVKQINWSQSLKEANKLLIQGPLEKSPYENFDTCITVDGGLVHTSQKTHWIGDGDSLGGLTPPHSNSLYLPQKKDQSDLHWALHLLPEKELKILLWGFMGERQDHQLAVFGECFNSLNARPQLRRLYSDNHWVFLAKGEHTIQIQGPFSLFSFEKAQVQIVGDCEYSMRTPAYLEPLSSRGLSNIGHGEINVKNESALVVYLNQKSFAKSLREWFS